MSQQLAIIVLVDVAAALRARALQGNTYLFDNMKLQGSEHEGTGDLVTAINGTYWFDGSQADEQVLNWLPYSLGSIPPTVPRGFHSDRSRGSDQEALEALAELAKVAGKPGTDVVAEIARIQGKLGTRTRLKSATRADTARVHHKVLDLNGEVVTGGAAGGQIPELANPTPVITDITGEAVDKNIIYPAQYGSPDLVTDGWYWSASVDTSRPGTYAYTMHLQLRELVWKDGWTWEPVQLTCESRIRVITEAKRNGFTQAGIGMLPLGYPEPH